MKVIVKPWDGTWSRAIESEDYDAYEAPVIIIDEGRTGSLRIVLYDEEGVCTDTTLYASDGGWSGLRVIEPPPDHLQGLFERLRAAAPSDY